MICVDCITPVPLKKLFDKYGMAGNCKYCGHHGPIIESKRLFDYIYERVEENVASKEELSPYELGMLYDCGSDFIPVADINIVLMEWFDLDSEAYVKDLCDAAPPEFRQDDVGETHFYGDDGTLERNIYEDRWRRFVEDIHYKHRYFNVEADQFLDSEIGRAHV